MRVLIVDDDRDLLADIEAIKPEGLELLTATGAEEAISLLSSEVVDAVLLDIRMPRSLARTEENEGLALLGVITGAYRGQMPVVVVTDSDDPDLTMWCGRLCATRILRKTAGVASALDAVMAAVSGTRAEAGVKSA